MPSLLLGLLPGVLLGFAVFDVFLGFGVGDLEGVVGLPGAPLLVGELLHTR